MFTTIREENEVVDSNTTAEICWRKVAYMPVIDSVINKIKYIFSEESLLIASSIDCFIKMDFVGSSYFINHCKVSIQFYIHMFSIYFDYIYFFFCRIFKIFE